MGHFDRSREKLEMLHRIKGERNILHTIERMNNWIDDFYVRTAFCNTLLKER